MLSLGFRNAGMFGFTGGVIPAQDDRNLSWRMPTATRCGWSSPRRSKARRSTASFAAHLQ